MKWNLQGFFNKASHGSLPGEAFCIYKGLLGKVHKGTFCRLLD